MSNVNVLTRNTPVVVLPSVSAANTAAATSSGIDLLGYEGLVEFLIVTGAVTGSTAPKLQDSADNSSFADITGATATAISTADQVRSIKVDVRNVRRYIKFVGTVTTGPILIGVVMNGFKKYN
jgi:hypothetical protein